MTTPDDLLIAIRSAERARLLPMGISKLYGEIREGRLQAVRLGGRVFIRQSEIQRYLAALPIVGRDVS